MAGTMRPKGSAETLEARRMRAAELLLEGRGIREVARLVKAVPSSVFRWKQDLEEGGLEALRAKPHPVSIFARHGATGFRLSWSTRRDDAAYETPVDG
jgi:transposase-like protein